MNISSFAAHSLPVTRNDYRPNQICQPPFAKLIGNFSRTSCGRPLRRERASVLFFFSFTLIFSFMSPSGICEWSASPVGQWECRGGMCARCASVASDAHSLPKTTGCWFTGVLQCEQDSGTRPGFCLSETSLRSAKGGCWGQCYCSSGHATKELSGWEGKSTPLLRSD